VFQRPALASDRRSIQAQIGQFWAQLGSKPLPTGDFSAGISPSPIPIWRASNHPVGLLTAWREGTFPLARSRTPEGFPYPRTKLILVISSQPATEITKDRVSNVVDAAISTNDFGGRRQKGVPDPRFGSFGPASARPVRPEPKTGEKIAIPAKRVPAFTAAKQFKNQVQAESGRFLPPAQQARRAARGLQRRFSERALSSSVEARPIV